MSYMQQMPAKKKVRVFSWFILAVNVLFLIWIIAGMASSAGDATNCQSLSQETCNNAQDVGTAIGVGIVVFLWVAADVILGVIWLVTRPKEKTVIIYQQAPGQQVAGWYPDQRDPQLVRYFDGMRYTEHTQRV